MPAVDRHTSEVQNDRESMDLSAFPTRYWIALDMRRPLTAYNVEATGALVSSAFASTDIDKSFLPSYLDGSADYLPFVPNPNASRIAVAPYLITAAGDYMVEYTAELIRRRINPRLPSRLTCLYAFGSKQDAIRAAVDSGRSRGDVREFQLFEHPLTRIARANMRIIDLARRAVRVASLSDVDRETMWRHYWNGGGKLAIELPVTYGPKRQIFEADVVWEYLIEGRLDLVSPDGRSQ